MLDQKSLIKMSSDLKAIEEVVSGLVYWINQSDILLSGLMKSMSDLELNFSTINLDWKDIEDI